MLLNYQQRKTHDIYIQCRLSLHLTKISSLGQGCGSDIFIISRQNRPIQARLGYDHKQDPPKYF
jgi:hypothetical protein